MTSEERLRLVAALDHDLRQPQHSIEMGLRSLRLTATDLRANAFDQIALTSLFDRLMIDVTSVEAAARQLTDSIRDLFDFIYLEVDKTQPTPRTIYAGDLIDRIQRSTRGLAVGIEVRGVPSRLTFISDENWVERVLNNLVGNAIWHSRGTRVVVGARRLSSDIVFEVRDNGRGMPPTSVNSVFDTLTPPYASRGSLTSNRSGLGLYNVRLFTHRLGGRVDCYSAAGKGTLFRVRLPGPVSTVEMATASFVGERCSDVVRKKLVAVLDDDPAVLRSIERALESSGAEVYSDHDPLRWLNVVTDFRRKPDLILMDFRLGREECSAHLEIVRRKWNSSDARVIVLGEDRRDPALAYTAGLVPVLQKPLRGPQFELIVSVLAGRMKLPVSGFL